MTMDVRIAAQNFRAIAPLRTEDGRRLKQGLLFRSGDLSDLTDHCVIQLQDLGIRSVVDLRSARERRRHPYDWLPTIDPQAWGAPAEDAAAAVSALLSAAESTVTEVTEGMRALYRDLPFSHADSYATLFHRVAEGRTPLLFGCAAGKDRTGVGALLLLWSVGVERTEIMADYLQSNDSFAALQALAARKYGWRGGDPGVDAGLRAEPDYLEAAIEAVTVRCGGIDAYVERQLGIGLDARKRIAGHLIG